MKNLTKCYNKCTISRVRHHIGDLEIRFQNIPLKLRVRHHIGDLEK